MIDFVSGRIEGYDPQKVRKNPNKTYKGTDIKVNELNDYRSEKQFFSFGHVTLIVINDEKVVFEFSLHKYAHDGNNYSDFYRKEIAEALNFLKKEFDVDLSKMELHKFEFGVVIRPPISPYDVIRRLRRYKGHEFTKSVIRNKHVNYAECRLQRYDIKIYDKGLQCELEDDCLKYEIRIKKMSQIKHSGISSLEDLRDSTKISKLRRMLFEVISRIEFDPGEINTDKLNRKDKMLIDQFSKIEAKKNAISRDRKSAYKRKKYLELVKRCSKDGLHIQLEKEIKKKWFLLEHHI